MYPGKAIVSSKNSDTDVAGVDVTPCSGTSEIVLREPIDRVRFEMLTALKKTQGVDAWIKLAKTLWHQCTKGTDGRLLWHTCHFVRKLYDGGSVELPFGRLYSKAGGDPTGKHQASLVGIDSSLRAHLVHGRIRELDVAKSRSTILCTGHADWVCIRRKLSPVTTWTMTSNV
jgi:hypothetical protein